MNYVNIMPKEMRKKAFFCSACGEKLIPSPRVRILTRGDPEYKKHKRVAKVHMIGDIELTEYDFKCSVCDRIITFKEQLVTERIQKGLGKLILSEEELEENAASAKAAIEKRDRLFKLIDRIIALAALSIAIYFYIRSEDCSIRFYL